MTDEQALEVVNMDEAKRMAALLLEAYPDGCWLKAKINVALVARALISQEARARKLVAALEGVIRVADRKTDEFDAARAALAEGRGK